MLTMRGRSRFPSRENSSDTFCIWLVVLKSDSSPVTAAAALWGWGNGAEADGTDLAAASAVNGGLRIFACSAPGFLTRASHGVWYGEPAMRTVLHWGQGYCPVGMLFLFFSSLFSFVKIVMYFSLSNFNFNEVCWSRLALFKVLVVFTGRRAWQKCEH